MQTHSLAAAPGADGIRLWPFPACIAVALPTLIAYNVPPSSTFLNQAAALIGWGAWLAWMAAALPAASRPRWGNGLAALFAALGLLLLAALVSPLWTHLPWSLALSSIALIAIAAGVVWAGAALQAAGLGGAAFRSFCIGLVVAGLASSVIGAVQVFAPGLADGNWIAHSVVDGRAVGNLRQPNHLSSLLLWAVIAAVWLGEAKVLHRAAALLLALVFLFVTVLSASRTGALGALMLGVWGLLDRRLSRPSRVLLMLMPVAYVAFWGGTSLWAYYGQHTFVGETRFSGGGDVSSSRFGIWSNTLSMIAAHPWAGVGYGEFNLAWTMTPFPGRPVAFFDHTHNIVLQFAVELGLPLALLVTGLLLWAFIKALAQARSLDDRVGGIDPPPVVRCAFMMVLMIGVHSLLEYPLWYAYFLLPTALAFGLCLGRPAVGAKAASARAAPPAGSWPMLAGGLLLMIGTLFSLYDYRRVVIIFAPPEGATPLAQRMEDGRHSWFFSHHADYAAATTPEHPADAMWAFKAAPHYLLDARLMIAWATALNETGDTQRARYVAQRLKEFRNDQAEDFFEPCDDPPEGDTPLPFQCLAPTQPLSYEDFR